MTVLVQIKVRGSIIQKKHNKALVLTQTTLHFVYAAQLKRYTLKGTDSE